MKRLRGRTVPPPLLAAAGYTPERIADLRMVSDAEFDALEAAAAAWPAAMRLSDGRELRKVETPGHATYRGPGGLLVIVSDDDSPHGPLRHVSLSYPTRSPTWDDFKVVRAAFFPPDVDVMMVLPRQGRYVNLAQHCFHLWQTPESWRGDRFV